MAVAAATARYMKVLFWMVSEKSIILAPAELVKRRSIEPSPLREEAGDTRKGV
jgi:hypothetical protein